MSADEDNENVGSPKVGILGQLLSMINRNIPLPTNARIYIESVIDGKKDPITNKDFTAEEIGIIRDLIVASTKSFDPNKPENKNKFHRVLNPTPVVNYDTYRKPLETEPRMFGMPFQSNAGIGALSVFDRKSRIATTLGQFGYKLNPEGGVDVVDRYDFNSHFAGRPTMGTQYAESNPFTKALTGVTSFGYLPLRAYGQERLPGGTGRDVQVTIPKEQFGMNYDEMLKSMQDAGF